LRVACVSVSVTFTTW